MRLSEKVSNHSTLSFLRQADELHDYISASHINKLSRRTVSILHLTNSMHTLYTVLYTFAKALTRRICLTINSFFNW